MTDAVRIARLDAYAYRVPIGKPVAMSFGVMRDRPTVFLRLEDEDGASGWGEAFADWPAAGAERRARLAIEDLGEIVLGREARSPEELWRTLSRETRLRAIQCGERGPLDQVLAELDIALWDLCARRDGVPLRQAIGAWSAGEVPVYARCRSTRAASTCGPAKTCAATRPSPR